MILQFVQRDPSGKAAISSKQVIDFVLERSPRYAKTGEGSSEYTNPDTGASFTITSLHPEGDGSVPIRLMYPTRMGLPFAAEIADEIEALTTQFDLLIKKNAVLYNEDAPFVRARFLLAYQKNLRSWLERDASEGKLSPPRMAKWWLEHAYQFNAQLASLRAWVWSEHPDGDVPRVVAIRTAKGNTAPAIVWDGRAAVLPEVEYLLKPNEAKTTQLAIPIAEVSKSLGSSRSDGERFTVNDATYEVSLRHWILNNEQRAAIDQLMAKSLGGESTPICPWPNVVDQDLFAEIVLLPLFERMSRGIVETSFALTWTTVSAHMPTFTSLEGNGLVSRAQGFNAQKTTIGFATPNEVARVAKALVDSHYPKCRFDDPGTNFRPPTMACGVRALGLGMHIAPPSMGASSADMDLLRAAVWSVIQEAEGRKELQPATGSPNYANAKEAIDDFLRARGHAWRVQQPMTTGSGEGSRPWSPDQKVQASVIVPPGYQPQVQHSCSWTMEIDWTKRTLIVAEYEDKGNDYAQPVTETIDDVWMDRFKAIRW
jgi:hypothetical protein